MLKENKKRIKSEDFFLPRILWLVLCTLTIGLTSTLRNKQLYTLTNEHLPPTLIRKKTKFSSYVRKFRWDWVQNQT
jgi:hypothetical protein